MTYPNSKIAPAKKAIAVIFAAIILMLVFFGGECLGQVSFKERIHFDAGAGWGDYDMKRKILRHGFNDVLRVRTVDASKRIEGGIEIYGEIKLDLSKNISISPGYLYSHGSRDLSEIPEYYGYDYVDDIPPINYEAYLLAPYLKLTYRSRFQSIIIYIMAGLHYMPTSSIISLLRKWISSM
jgi:hypothetical protein